MSVRTDCERGNALVIVLLMTTLLGALGAVLVLTTRTELNIARHFRSKTEASYAADAILERVRNDMRHLSDWSSALDGTASSSFIDGAAGPRTLSDGSTLDLVDIVNMANCAHHANCSSAEMDAVSSERPWGANNPRWRVFASGPLPALIADASFDSPLYVVGLIADDPSENDGNPNADGQIIAGANPGTGVVLVRGEAFGPAGLQRSLEATLGRIDPPPGSAALPDVRIMSWQEIR